MEELREWMAGRGPGAQAIGRAFQAVQDAWVARRSANRIADLLNALHEAIKAWRKEEGGVGGSGSARPLAGPQVDSLLLPLLAHSSSPRVFCEAMRLAAGSDIPLLDGQQLGGLYIATASGLARFPGNRPMQVAALLLLTEVVGGSSQRALHAAMGPILESSALGQLCSTLAEVGELVAAAAAGDSRQSRSSGGSGRGRQPAGASRAGGRRHGAARSGRGSRGASNSSHSSASSGSGSGSVPSEQLTELVQRASEALCLLLEAVAHKLQDASLFAQASALLAQQPGLVHAVGQLVRAPGVLSSTPFLRWLPILLCELHPGVFGPLLVVQGAFSWSIGMLQRTDMTEEERARGERWKGTLQKASLEFPFAHVRQLAAESGAEAEDPEALHAWAIQPHNSELIRATLAPRFGRRSYARWAARLGMDASALVAAEPAGEDGAGGGGGGGGAPAEGMPCPTNSLLFPPRPARRCGMCGARPGDTTADHESSSGAAAGGGAGAGAGGGVKLRACAQCRLALFCSRDCQLRAWREGHKGHCALLAQLRGEVESGQLEVEVEAEAAAGIWSDPRFLALCLQVKLGRGEGVELLGPPLARLQRACAGRFWEERDEELGQLIAGGGGGGDVGVGEEDSD